MVERHVKTFIDWTSFDLRYKDFFAWNFEQSATEKTHLLCYWPTIRRSVLNFEFSLSLFWGRWAARWAMSKISANRKYFNFNLCRIWHWQYVSEEGLWSRILVYLVWLQQSENEKPAHKILLQGCEIWRFICCLFRQTGTNLWLSV